MFGSSYVLNRASVGKVGPYLKECMATVVSNHSDTEVGRCVLRHVGVECGPGSLASFFQQVFWVRVGRGIKKFTREATGQMFMPFPTVPFRVHFDAAMVHSIKDPADYVRFHRLGVSRKRIWLW